MTCLFVDLYLLLVHTARLQLTKNPKNIEHILIHWFHFLALSWVHDDELIRSEGALWATEIARAVPVEMRKLILDGLILILSGRFTKDGGKAGLSKDTRRRIILSEPFRGLFNWAITHWPREWETNPVSPGGKNLPAYNYDIMKDMARHVASLPADYFDVDPQASATQNPAPPVHSSSTPPNTTARRQTYPLALEARPPAGRTPPLME